MIKLPPPPNRDAPEIGFLYAGSGATSITRIEAARAVPPAVSPALVDASAIESGLAEANVDAIVHLAEPLRKRVLRLRLGRILLQVLAQLLRAITARIEFGEEVEKAVHTRLLLFRRLIGIVGGHRVEKRPGLLTELVRVHGTVVAICRALRSRRCTATRSMTIGWAVRVVASVKVEAERFRRQRSKVGADAARPSVGSDRHLHVLGIGASAAGFARAGSVAMHVVTQDGRRRRRIGA